MEMSQLDHHRYSRMIANSQEADTINKFWYAFLAALASYEFPQRLRNIGLEITGSANGAPIRVKAHGFVLEPTFTHAWLYTNDQDGQFQQLVGQIRFWLKGRDPIQDKVVFDDEVNARIGAEGRLSTSITEGAFTLNTHVRAPAFS